MHFFFLKTRSWWISAYIIDRLNDCKAKAFDFFRSFFKLFVALRFFTYNFIIFLKLKIENFKNFFYWISLEAHGDFITFWVKKNIYYIAYYYYYSSKIIDIFKFKVLRFKLLYEGKFFKEFQTCVKHIVQHMSHKRVVHPSSRRFKVTTLLLKSE